MNNNINLNVCNNDKLNEFRAKIACETMKEIACEPLIETTCEPTVCKPTVCELVNEPACKSPQNEKVFPEPKNEKFSPEFVKIKDITFKTLKKERKLRGHKIEKPCSDSSSCSNSSDESNNSTVKAMLFPKLKNIPNALFVKSGCSKASTSRLTSIVMKENSDCSSDSKYSSDGYNNSDDWKTHRQYVSGNLNKNMKPEHLEQTHKQKQNQDYKRKMRTKRKSFQNHTSLDQSNFNCCQCNCKNPNKIIKPVISYLSENALRKHNKSFATKRISQKELKRVFQEKDLPQKYIPKQKVVLEQNPNENENQKFDKPAKTPFVPYIKNYPLRGPKQVWVPKFI